MSDDSATQVREERVTYQAGDTKLVGYLATPATTAEPAPGVLVFPEWWGVTEYPRQRARQLAELGYVAFAADMFGDGVTTDEVEEAARLSGDTRLGPVSRERGRAALEVLTSQPQVDVSRVAAIGFCFGGDVALELARDGADLSAVVAFHASLTSIEPAGAGRFEPSVLVLHGADDPLTPPERVAAFEDEMRAAGADWQLVSYSGAVHSFTNPEADTAGLDGVAYHATAARRAWEHHLAFLEEVV
ncbi:dienelactone hydrolase family protein [Egicoccus sp. AB-alg2]|uniref:dienelactone hydrolase family protein n=1 Tax=Egicoccus sp. AB-alg2 TaxID=3242693 RepID=UPI00359CBFF4